MQITRNEDDAPAINAAILAIGAALGHRGEVHAHDLLILAANRIEEERVAEKIAGDPRDQAAEYLRQLQRFTRANAIPRDLASRIRKAGEELGELSEAAILEGWFGESGRDVRSEAADLINVGVDILLITAGDGPDAMLSVYPWLILNLMEKAAKYDRGENRIGGRD
ncbi:hypothetical protein CCP3SC15_360010 [Gammaproteobacteria bacterium]